MKLAAATIGILSALSLFAAAPATAVSFATTEGSCTTDVAVDFEAPLRELPPTRSVPSDRQLPFGPTNAFLHPRAQMLGVLLSGAAKRGSKPKPGYVLAFPSQTGHAGGARLDWIVTAKLARIGADGEIGRTLAWKRRRVGRAHGDHPFFLPAPERRAKYRVQIVFRDRKGKVLGRYAEYFRVLPNVTEARLTLNASTFTPGQTIAGCLENLGTERITYGACGFTLERLVATSWTPSPFEPPTSCPAIGLSLPPGGTAMAGAETIPADAEPGRYRARFAGTSTEFEILPAA